MSDSNPHHPGVRSLLAKFEGQSPITSPPSRGRSPAASDTSGTARQLSRVRASFVNVEGAIQSNPASPLRKTSGRSDSPGIFGPKINSEDVQSGRQNMASPTPASPVEHTQNATLAQIMAEGRPEPLQSKPQLDSTTQEPAAHSETTPPSQDAPKAGTASAKSKSTSSETHSQDTDASTKRKPSTVRSTANKPSTTPTSTGGQRSQAPTSKPSAREVAKERSNSLAHKPSRVSLNPMTTTRPIRGATPLESPKPSITMNKSTRQSTTMQPPPKPATAGASTRTANTLTRKPSTLRSAAGAQQQATPSTGVRRQSSRASLPAQPANERPSSRTSDVHSNKPVNEGFLARMMRPTASSANKSHEKTDAKPAPKTTSAPKAPRQSIGGRVPERTASQSKPKATTLRPQSEKSQAANKATVRDHPIPQKKQESEKENIVEPTPASPKKPVTVEKAQLAVVEQPEAIAKPVEEVVVSVQTEKPAEKAASTIEPTEKSAEVSEPAVEALAEPIDSGVKVETNTEVEAPVRVQPVAEAEIPVKAEVEAPVETIEPIPEAVEEEQTVETTTTPEVADATPAQVDETIEEPKASAPIGVEATGQMTVFPGPELDQEPESKVEVPEKDETVSAKDTIVPETSDPEAKSADVKRTETKPATEAESSNVALDITTLALN
ncbi:hypothetical protein PENANT_c006G04112 [Penicillium antarcticum]|uniref:Mucin-7 n=1 Tax=Penicillium antarcticum TaxID=416450 RepID=A0A1V6QCS1_9EURO|nr:uncharacterized protein N7508_009166 [Penicillium antarcticum]KAJ5294345.1 hypothetical protein N7508_009166 [Penicillium antarcticum]OQD87011.1 hypothetical protein PENANT_c006G04112 [Penicillium antarcticum]